MNKGPQTPEEIAQAKKLRTHQKNQKRKKKKAEKREARKAAEKASLNQSTAPTPTTNEAETQPAITVSSTGTMSSSSTETTSTPTTPDLTISKQILSSFQNMNIYDPREKKKPEKELKYHRSSYPLRSWDYYLELTTKEIEKFINTINPGMINDFIAYYPSAMVNHQFRWAECHFSNCSSANTFVNELKRNRLVKPNATSYKDLDHSWYIILDGNECLQLAAHVYSMGLKFAPMVPAYERSKESSSRKSSLLQKQNATVNSPSLAWRRKSGVKQKMG